MLASATLLYKLTLSLSRRIYGLAGGFWYLINIPWLQRGEQCIRNTCWCKLVQSNSTTNSCVQQIHKIFKSLKALTKEGFPLQLWENTESILAKGTPLIWWLNEERSWDSNLQPFRRTTLQAMTTPPTEECRGSNTEGEQYKLWQRGKNKKAIYFHYEKKRQSYFWAVSGLFHPHKFLEIPSWQQKLLWATSRWVCCSLTAKYANKFFMWGINTHTLSLSGRPSWELQEVSPVRVSCSPLWWLPPFPGNWGQSPSPYTHQNSCRAINTPDTHIFFSCCSLHHAHTHPTPAFHITSIHPSDADFLINCKRRRDRETSFILFISRFVFLLVPLFSAFRGLADNHKQGW